MQPDIRAIRDGPSSYPGWQRVVSGFLVRGKGAAGDGRTTEVRWPAEGLNLQCTSATRTCSARLRPLRLSNCPSGWPVRPAFQLSECPAFAALRENSSGDQGKALTRQVK